MEIFKQLTNNYLGLNDSNQAGIFVPKEIIKNRFFPTLSPKICNLIIKLIFKLDVINYSFNWKDKIL